MLKTATGPKVIHTYRIPNEIKIELGHESRNIETIKVISFQDRLNTRGVYVCMKDDEVVEEVSPTPMQACGLVTILNGKFVLIQNKGETTLHFVNARNEDDVIDEVHILSEHNGLADGIMAYKSMVRKLDPAKVEDMS